MLGPYRTSWKEPYHQALKESDKQKLTELVHAAEHAIVLRLQELENSADNQEELIQMKRAAADLLAITPERFLWRKLVQHFPLRIAAKL